MWWKIHQPPGGPASRRARSIRETALRSRIPPARSASSGNCWSSGYPRLRPDIRDGSRESIPDVFGTTAQGSYQAQGRQNRPPWDGAPAAWYPSPRRSRGYGWRGHRRDTGGANHSWECTSIVIIRYTIHVGTDLIEIDAERPSMIAIER